MRFSFEKALRLCALAMLSLSLCWTAPANAQAVTLDNITFSKLGADRVLIQLELSEPVSEPLSFAIDNPARLALDFAGVELNITKKTQNIGVGMARSVAAVEAAGRTRVVLNLVKLVPYELQVDGSNVFITLEGPGAMSAAAFQEGGVSDRDGNVIENVDFRRGERGEGRVLVTLSDPSVVVDTREDGQKVIIDFFASGISDELIRRLDVIDFATPVQLIDTFRQGNHVRMVVETSGNFDLIAYQSDNLFTVDVKPLSKSEEEQTKKKKFGYTGERLSLNFQNIEVRAVLQLIADFTGLNLVASDTVGGSLTLRLKNVPWDQALDIILRSKGLAKRQDGNVIMVAPSEEIAAREKLELEAQKQIDELEPLQTEFIQVNYAKATDLSTLVKAEENSMLSERGNVTVDERTNTLLVRDTASNLVSIRQLVATLDIPVRQVLIESRIVVADNSWMREVGVRWGYSRNTGNFPNNPPPGGAQAIIGGKIPGDVDYGSGTSFTTDGNENLMVDLPVIDPTGSIAFAVGKVGSYLLQMELNALQLEGRGEVLSNPKVITSNQKEAIIEQGTEIPFQEASSSGATSTSFKKAVLSLRVTPQITPDDRIIMDLAVNQDTVGQEFSGIPSVDTRALNTQVLVDNGETVVLGGIYEQTKRKDVDSVPFFGELPYLGWLFRNTSEINDQVELLVFVTPRILKEALSLN